MPHANFTEGTKVCSRPDCALAGQEQPIENFARNRGTTDGYQYSCKKCGKTPVNKPSECKLDDKPAVKREKLVQKQLEAKRAEDRRLALTVKAVNQAARSPRITQLEEVAGNLMQSFGGVKQYADRLVNAIDEAENPGHKIRGLLGAGQIFAEASKLAAANAQDLDLLSDDDLQARINELIDKRLSQGAIDVEYEVKSEEIG